MALRIWLPLNGDLRNLGCSNITITPNASATVQNSGKIGKCYCPATMNLTDFNNLSFDNSSFCFWAKTSSTTSWQLIMGIDNTSLSQIHGIYVADASRYKLEYNPSLNIYDAAISQWHHYAFVIKNGNSQAYYDGVLKTTSTEAVTNDAIGRIRLGVGAAISLNDVRIYDHCLSAAEVKEISQGLVLHYKLNEIGPHFGNPNLLVDGMTPTAAGNGASGITREIENGIQKVIAASSNGNWCTFSNHNTTLALTKGDTFTFSLMIKSPDSIKKPTVYFQNGLGYYSMQGTMSTDWSIIYYTGAWSIDNLQTNIHLGFSSAPGTYYIKYFKLEKNSTPTAWAPKEGESLSDLNYIQDNSGYNNNGSTLGNVKISSDTARYQSSIDLLTASTAINCGRGGMITDSITVNIWLKSSAWNNPVSCTEGGGWNFEASGDYFRFPVYISGVGYKYGQSTTTKAQLCNNQWHMLTGIYDRINQKVQIYVDGKLDNDYAAGTSNNIGYHGSNVIWIGAEASSSNTAPYNYGMRGLFSDFRIYCTALSADDILQLYHTGAKIDNKANFHTFEFNEFNTNKLTKTGIMNDNMEESIMTLPDGSCWQLLLFHYVDGGKNLFTSSNATDCNEFGLFSRLKDINNFTYNGKYEFYVIQDDVEYRWTQTNQPTASTISGLTTVSGYTNPVNGLAKANQSNTYIGYNAWWGACGCWTSYSTGGKTGIPGFGAHNANGICTRYMALYARIEKADVKISNQTLNASEIIEL